MHKQIHSSTNGSWINPLSVKQQNTSPWLPPTPHKYITHNNHTPNQSKYNQVPWSDHINQTTNPLNTHINSKHSHKYLLSTTLVTRAMLYTTFPLLPPCLINTNLLIDWLDCPWFILIPTNNQFRCPMPVLSNIPTYTWLHYSPVAIDCGSPGSSPHPQQTPSGPASSTPPTRLCTS